MKELEKENAWLKKLVAHLNLDNFILKVADWGNFQAHRGGAERWSEYEICSAFLKGGHAGCPTGQEDPTGRHIC